MLVSAQSPLCPYGCFVEIGNTIEGASSIVGGIIALVIAIVPLILIIAVVGFLTGTFDSVGKTIKSKTKI